MSLPLIGRRRVGKTFLVRSVYAGRISAWEAPLVSLAWRG